MTFYFEDSYVEEDIATPIRSLQQLNDVVTDVDMSERFPLIDPRISVKPPEVNRMDEVRFYCFSNKSELYSNL